MKRTRPTLAISCSFASRNLEYDEPLLTSINQNQSNRLHRLNNTCVWVTFSHHFCYPVSYRHPWIDVITFHPPLPPLSLKPRVLSKRPELDPGVDLLGISEGPTRHPLLYRIQSSIFMNRFATLLHENPTTLIYKPTMKHAESPRVENR